MTHGWEGRRKERSAAPPSSTDAAKSALATCSGRSHPSSGLPYTCGRDRGRLVTRQLDDDHVVIHASFDFRDFLLHSFPETFSVPRRFAKHMMIAADLEHGNPDVVEDALIAAWELQSGR